MNITYLLGAGASANCLPVINELPDKLRNFSKYMQRDNLATDIEELKNKLLKDINWLLNEMAKHKTVDTLARRFYLKKETHPDLLRLKKVLILYFLFEQSFSHGNIRDDPFEGGVPKECPDRRYDTFIASIISSSVDKLELPGNIKIITWNYDLQMELAYYEYNQQSLPKTQEILQCIPNTAFMTGEPSFELEKFGLIRLNGVAGIGEIRSIKDETSPEPKTYLDYVRGMDYRKLFANLMSYYRLLENEGDIAQEQYKAFNFSWESTDEFGNYLYDGYNLVKDQACKVMQATDILVIIGYSFPYFNRAVDKTLLSHCPNLKKVYLQDFNAKSLKQLLSASFPIFQAQVQHRKDRMTGFVETKPKVPIEEISYADQFFIPYELS